MKDKPNSQEGGITSMRDDARRLREAHNKLVDRLWEIEIKLADVEDETLRTSLSNRRDRIKATLEETKSLEQFKSLIEQIRDLEIEIYGKSDIGDSPYVL